MTSISNALLLTAVLTLAGVTASVAQTCPPGDCGENRGPKGDKGDPGDRGPKGDPGDRGKDGLPGKDGLNGINGRDGIDGKDGAPGTCQGLCGVEYAESVHWDGEYQIALTPKAFGGTISRASGKRSDEWVYMPETDAMLVFDYNAPTGPRVLAFKRGGEVVPWQIVGAIGPRVFSFKAQNPMTGKLHHCIVSLDKLLAYAEAQGLSLGWHDLAQFTTQGVLSTLSADAWAAAQVQR